MIVLHFWENYFKFTELLYPLYPAFSIAVPERIARAREKGALRKALPLCHALVEDLPLLFATHLSETVAAINGTVALRLKGNPCFPAAVGASGSKELSGATGRIFAGVTAGLAALRLILETVFRVKLLFTGGEHELIATFFTYQSLVFEHF